MPRSLLDSDLEYLLRVYHLGPPPRPTAASLAERLGVHPQTVYAILRGRWSSGRPHSRSVAVMPALGLAVVDGSVVQVADPGGAL